MNCHYRLLAGERGRQLAYRAAVVWASVGVVLGAGVREPLLAIGPKGCRSAVLRSHRPG